MATLTEGASVGEDAFAWAEGSASGALKTLTSINPLFVGTEPVPACGAGGGGGASIIGGTIVRRASGT